MIKINKKETKIFLCVYQTFSLRQLTDAAESGGICTDG
jgi:hypothetical protein